MIADFPRFASVGITCRRIGAVEQTLAVSMFCDFPSRLSVIVGDLELGRQLQV